MSRRKEILDLIANKPGMTYPQVQQALAHRGYTVEQVRASMHFLSFAGALRCEQGQARGRGIGRHPGRYFVTGEKPKQPRPDRANKGLRRPKPQPVPPVSSPWDMAHGIDMPWPPKFDGGRVFLHMAREDFMQEVA